MASLAPLREGAYADRLRAQARALQRRAFDMVREAEGLKAEAVELATEADLLDNSHTHVTVGAGRLHVPAPTPVAPAAPKADMGALFAERVCELISAGGMTVAQIAEHLCAPRQRVKAVLGRLEDDGRVYRTGQTRSTRYHLAAPEPDRSGSATLRVFTKTMPARELEDREIAYTTEAPAVAGALPDRDD